MQFLYTCSNLSSTIPGTPGVGVGALPMQSGRGVPRTPGMAYRHRGAKHENSGAHFESNFWGIL